MIAPGKPGIEPRWTSSHKDGVGTAIDGVSRIWFTLSHGIVNEVYYPRVDQANLRDCQFLILSRDGQFWEEKRDLDHRIELVDGRAPAYHLLNTERTGRFQIDKRVISWPDGAVLLQQFNLRILEGEPDDYRFFLLIAPHLANQGMANSARVAALPGHGDTVEAWRENTWLSVRCDIPFRAASVGYVGASDGWTLIRGEHQLPPYTDAPDGNVALTVELDLHQSLSHTVALAFGVDAATARLSATWSLLHPYAKEEGRYLRGWQAYLDSLPNLLPLDHPHARMQHASAVVLRTHCDKTFSGALIASLSIPWGEEAGDQDLGGYHLVWPRDLVESAQALAAIGDWEQATKALEYLMATQHPEGCWSQNFWIDGRPYWNGAQLDETAFPIHLAYRLVDTGRIAVETVWPMVRAAMAYLVQNGPVTQQDRWEENAGYSPATIAAAVTALLLGAQIARRMREWDAAEYAESLADDWVLEVDRWTFTTEGDIVPGHPCYYQRLHPASSTPTDGNIHHGFIPIKNIPPGDDPLIPEYAVIDPGFLELVRYGIKAPDDPHIVSSLEVVDLALSVRMPYGPLWYRYNHDGYGEHADGSPYRGYGKGRLWPLLSGERGHYELAAGHDPEPLLRAMEGAASPTFLIPEQVWDEADIPQHELVRGRPSGSAMPLVWAHAEYLKLLRSVSDGRVFECYDPVYKRYATHPPNAECAWWQYHRPIEVCPARVKWLRISVPRPAILVITLDAWAHHETLALNPSGLGTYFADFPIGLWSQAEFTFHWEDDQSWVGRNFQVRVDPEPLAQASP